jgi:LysM repeat protein
MKTVLLSLILLISLSLMGQQPKFVVRNSGSQLYLEHKVAPKENWYSVGRIYFISPKEIAAFNQLSMDKGLGIGQLLKIPLRHENFSQSTAVENAGGKVVHVVQAKEGLYKLSNLYKIDKEVLKKMNGLSSDQVNAGTNLVIGYLLPSGESVVSLAASNPAKAAPEVVKPPKVEEKELVVEEKTKKPAPPPEAVASASQTSAKIIQPATPVKVVEETVEPVKPVASTPKSTTSLVAKPEKSYFSSLFDQQSKEGKQQKLENSVYGVFKSTSGWQDGKYYVLMNNVVPGTVVKLVRKSTDKVVFAKVLGAVPPGKESEGMSLRMSNAAIAALGLGETGNDVDLVWFN